MYDTSLLIRVSIVLEKISWGKATGRWKGRVQLIFPHYNLPLKELREGTKVQQEPGDRS